MRTRSILLAAAIVFTGSAFAQDPEPQHVKPVHVTHPRGGKRLAIDAGFARIRASVERKSGVTERTCGACAACCFFPAVESLAKPAFQLCQHSSARGCGIYPGRPGECRDYECLWLSSDLGELTDRPDQLGIVFDRPTLIAEHADYAGIDFVCARELHEGARHGARAAELLRRFSRTWVVRLTRRDGGTQLTGPESLVRLLLERAQARARG